MPERGTTDDFLDANERFAREGFAGPLPLRPSLATAIVACMDSRMPIFKILGLQQGEAHIIRNAGGVITDDVIRSLVISQRLMGTRRIVLIHHTDCGLTKFSEDQMRIELEEATGMTPRFAFETFRDAYANVRQSARRLRLSPFLLHREEIAGFVYDVTDGRLRQVEIDAP